MGLALDFRSWGNSGHRVDRNSARSARQSLTGTVSDLPAKQATLRWQSQLRIFQFPFLSVGEPETYFH